METIGVTKQDNILISDYAHHPSEIIPTLKAIKTKYPEKQLIVAFQPHQYSRTIELLEDFTKSFDAADTLFIPNIYFSRDSQDDVKNMPTELFVERIQKQHKNTLYTHSLLETFSCLQKLDV